MSTADNDDTLPYPVEPTKSVVPEELSVRPRTRWASIIWGAVFAALAALGLWTFLRPTGRHGLGDWIMSLTPGTMTAYSLLALGVLVLVIGLVGLLRRAQRKWAERQVP